MDLIRLPNGDDDCFTYSMRSMNHLPISRTSTYASIEPFQPYSDELWSTVLRGANPPEGKSFHQRCTSESNLLEEPPWFDDLLNEPGSSPLSCKGHRRSASDSSAYISMLAYATDDISQEKGKLKKCPPWEPVNLVHHEDMWKSSIKKTRSPVDLQNSAVGESSSTSEICSSDIDGNALETSASLSMITKKHDEDYTVSQNQEGLSAKASIPQTKPSVSKGEEKCAKQQSAHRSRIRKLQYIADLERNIQVLQVESSEFSAAIEFLYQQKFILGMENRALQQRLDSLSHEHMIKHMEHEMLEREIMRIQAICELQMQQQAKHHPEKNRDQLNVQLTTPFYHN